ncbi:anaerobic sulfatase maturase [Gammaproteobacteria bacterium 42_54_T18]|nr:anaerobic sulfatase maturase [Gammaproteobacteria bacterium 42_54_T18]
MNGVHIMTKPTGSVCNLDCDYCFYLEKEKLYPDNKNFKMSEEVLEAYIEQNIEAQPKEAEFYTFAWQGGEPTLMGLDFFKKAVSLQKKYSAGKRCENTFQTNGLLLNDDWCQFFAKEQFLVGISIDGTEQQHDIYRKNRAGRGSHKQVLTAIQRLQHYAVELNALTVLHKGNVDEPLKVYHYLLSLGIKHIQFTPLVEREAQEKTKDGLTLVHPKFLGKACVSPWSITANQYARFLNIVFDEWTKNGIGDVFINTFETTLGLAIGEPSNICIHAETCGNAVILEHNGDLYSCDHFVYPEYKLGNINTKSISQMAQLPVQKLFGRNKLDDLSVECQSCKYISLCNGGCPKHRFEISANGKANKNYFCDGYKSYYSHVIPKMRIIYQALINGEIPEKLKEKFQNIEVV